MPKFIINYYDSRIEEFDSIEEILELHGRTYTTSHGIRQLYSYRKSAEKDKIDLMVYFLGSGRSENHWLMTSQSVTYAINEDGDRYISDIDISDLYIVSRHDSHHYDGEYEVFDSEEEAREYVAERNLNNVPDDFPTIYDSLEEAQSSLNSFINSIDKD